MKKAVFFDRDGVLIYDPGHLSEVEQIKILPGIIPFLKRIKEKNYLIIIVSNQAGVAKDFLTLADLYKIDKVLKEKFSQKGIMIDDSFYCPHHPDHTGFCRCRKPEPALFLAASQKWNIDLRESIVIGDKPSDCEAGKKAGCRVSILVKRNFKNWDLKQGNLDLVDYRAESLNKVYRILKKEKVL